jgi:hypothetical protein
MNNNMSHSARAHGRSMALTGLTVVEAHACGARRRAPNLGHHVRCVDRGAAAGGGPID